MQEKQSDLITMIVPIYNAEKYLDRCILSIVQQDYQMFELILVDDGSTDNSLQLCHDWAKKDARFHVIHQENQGPTGAIQNGLQFAKGEFCAFVDSDDWVMPDLISYLHRAMTENDVDGVRCGYFLHTEDGGVASDPVKIISENRRYTKQEIETEILKKFFETTGDFTDTWSNSRCAKLYKTDLLKRVIDHCDSSLRMGEDVELNLRYLHECNSLILLANFCGYCINVHGDSTCRLFSVKHIEWYLHFLSCLHNIATEHNRPGRALNKLQDYLMCCCIQQLLDSSDPLAKKQEYTMLAKQHVIRKITMFKMYARGPLSALGYFLIFYVDVKSGIVLLNWRKTIWGL